MARAPPHSLTGGAPPHRAGGGQATWEARLGPRAAALTLAGTGRGARSMCCPGGWQAAWQRSSGRLQGRGSKAPPQIRFISCLLRGEWRSEKDTLVSILCGSGAQAEHWTSMTRADLSSSLRHPLPLHEAGTTKGLVRRSSQTAPQSPQPGARPAAKTHSECSLVRR